MKDSDPRITAWYNATHINRQWEEDHNGLIPEDRHEKEAAHAFKRMFTINGMGEVKCEGYLCTKCFCWISMDNYFCSVRGCGSIFGTNSLEPEAFLAHDLLVLHWRDLEYSAMNRWGRVYVGDQELRQSAVKELEVHLGSIEDVFGKPEWYFTYQSRQELALITA